MPYNPYNGNYYGDGSDAQKNSSGQTVMNNKTNSTTSTYGTSAPSSWSSGSSSSSGSSNSSGSSSNSGSYGQVPSGWQGPTLPTGPSSVIHDSNMNRPDGSGWGSYTPPVDPLQLQLEEMQRQYQALLQQQMQKPPTLSFGEAQSRAQSQLNPLYDQTLKQALQQVDSNNIRRGFFGQMPGAALERSTAADIESRKAAAIGQMANQLVGQSESQATAQQQLGMQQQQAQLQALLNGMQEARAKRMTDTNIYQIMRQLQMQQQGQNWDQKLQEAAIRDMWYLD